MAFRFQELYPFCL